MTGRDGFHVGAGSVARFVQRQKRSNFLNTKPQFARTPNKCQLPEVLVTVMAVAAFGTGRPGHETDPFIVPDGLEIDLGGLGKLANFQPPDAHAENLCLNLY